MKIIDHKYCNEYVRTSNDLHLHFIRNSEDSFDNAKYYSSPEHLIHLDDE